jgi:hypothetical protein
MSILASFNHSNTIEEVYEFESDALSGEEGDKKDKSDSKKDDKKSKVCFKANIALFLQFSSDDLILLFICLDFKEDKGVKTR